MKWMCTDDRDEWQAMLDEALDADGRLTYMERAGIVRNLLNDARQAHRPWVGRLIEESILKGIAAALRYRSGTRNRVLVAMPKGRSIERKARRGVRQRSADGTVFHQQKLIHELTWAEALDLLDGLNGQIASLSDSRTMLRRLVKLRDAAPESSGPGDAARQLGTTLEDVLAVAS